MSHWSDIRLGALVPVVAPSVGVGGTTFHGRVLAMHYREREGTLELEIEAMPPATVATLERMADRVMAPPSVPINTDWIRILLDAWAGAA